jgi:hypothetical protein
VEVSLAHDTIVFVGLDVHKEVTADASADARIDG